MNSEWYCEIGGATTGPFTVEELLKMATDGTLGAADRVRREDGAWIDADRLPGLTFPAGRPKRREALSARPPAPSARGRTPRPADEPGDDPVIDILVRGFDSPAVRGERLRVLTGGGDPVEQLRTCKVTSHRKSVGFLTTSHAPPTEHFADLIFTDTGLLIANLAPLPKRGESGNAGWLHFGLIGLLVYSIAESRRMSRGKTQADTTYFQMADEWADATPARLFKRVPLADFIPADEITGARVRSSGVLEFRFRGFKYRAKPDKYADHPSYKMPDAQEFEAWRHEAAARRAALSGGPPAGGPAALVEWSDRSAADVGIPAWVAAAVQIAEENWGDRPKEVLRWVPKKYHPGLFFRLAEVNTAPATAWHQRLGKRLRLRGYVFLGLAMLIAGLIAAPLGVLAVSLAGQLREDPTGPAVLSGLAGITALIFLLWGVAVLIRFRNRPGHESPSRGGI